MADEEKILEVRDLTVKVGNVALVENISFAVKKGETVLVIGPNGAGKTTLFRALIGSVPYFGEVKWGEGASIGYVPQKVDLERDLPITVREFFMLKTGNIGEAEVKEALLDVKLESEYAEKGISELSSGELQRILIAWAVLGHPKVLLFDEPTASIDVAGQETIYELLHNLQDTHDLTLIMISHDLTVVYKYATQVLCLNKEQICFGSPREVLTPEELSKLYGPELTFYHHLH
ncbi:hypothetical protein A2Z53_00590 [Candidatus Giovannonibacteria bacterium RIFCSPHIGHO2_02_42_15]|uniref:ABC transporter domain-containing protein n=2 Tax=Candidatus Giovannoniibacteriota TaxID=1752738 RepID=A0A1F5VLU6_9BACT|nr:MAG: hypothetical protein UV11_C0006G0057 [Candidatus Giovannonibacteria bacterium GW2011_GWF2_42_19]OGF64370.1 MAG: hypothetical protein A2Z53_00590 [Candidatus Giovannonibacteria bacterium RIFCSPHIGHO2_02_42_15]